MKFQRSTDLSRKKTSTGRGGNSWAEKGEPSSTATEDTRKSLSVLSMTCQATNSALVSFANDKAYVSAPTDSLEKSMGAYLFDFAHHDFLLKRLMTVFKQP